MSEPVRNVKLKQAPKTSKYITMSPEEHSAFLVDNIGSKNLPVSLLLNGKKNWKQIKVICMECIGTKTTTSTALPAGMESTSNLLRHLRVRVGTCSLSITKVYARKLFKCD